MGKKPVTLDEYKRGDSAVLHKARSFLKTLEEGDADSFTNVKTNGERFESGGESDDPLTLSEDDHGTAHGPASDVNGTVELPGCVPQKIVNLSSGEHIVKHFTGDTKPERDHCSNDDVTSCPEIQANEAVDADKMVKQKRRRRKRRKCLPMPPDVASDDELRKYWAQRYRLFSRFDEGIRMDRG